MVFFFFKQKTAYEMRISDWSSDVCSSDLPALNYYHWKLGSEAAMNETLRGYLSALRAPLPGAPLVLVGHSTAFAAMGVAAPKAGGGLVLKPNGTATPEVVGAIAAPE